MFKKIEESAQNAIIMQRNLDIKMAYNDIDVLSVKKYFSQQEEQVKNEKLFGMNTHGRNRI